MLKVNKKLIANFPGFFFNLIVRTEIERGLWTDRRTEISAMSIPYFPFIIFLFKKKKKRRLKRTIFEANFLTYFPSKVLTSEKFQTKLIPKHLVGTKLSKCTKAIQQINMGGIYFI